jgi:hypothetical protein
MMGKMTSEQYEEWRKSRMHGPPGKEKIQYHTKRFAKKRIAERFGPEHVKMTAYKCEYCGYWHIGHKTDGQNSYAEDPLVDLTDASDDDLFAALDTLDAEE